MFKIVSQFIKASWLGRDNLQAMGVLLKSFFEKKLRVINLFIAKSPHDSWAVRNSR